MFIIYKHTPFLIMLKDLIPEFQKCEHNLSHCWLRYELQGNGGCQVYPFYTPPAVLWFVVADPRVMKMGTDKASHSSKQFKRQLCMCGQLHLWYNVSCLGSQLAQTYGSEVCGGWFHRHNHD
jgi:hypothetical protein